MQLVCQVLDGFLEFQPFNIHHELDDAATSFAAEAVVHLPFLIDGERRGLFSMEGTKTPMTVAVALERNVLANDLHDVRAGTKLVQPGCRKSRHKVSPPFHRHHRAVKPLCSFRP